MIVPFFFSRRGRRAEGATASSPRLKASSPRRRSTRDVAFSAPEERDNACGAASAAFSKADGAAGPADAGDWPSKETEDGREDGSWNSLCDRFFEALWGAAEKSSDVSSSRIEEDISPPPSKWGLIFCSFTPEILLSTYRRPPYSGSRRKFGCVIV